MMQELYPVPDLKNESGLSGEEVDEMGSMSAST